MKQMRRRKHKKNEKCTARKPEHALWVGHGLEPRPQCHEKTQREKKGRILGREREKKSEIWGGPAEGRLSGRRSRASPSCGSAASTTSRTANSTTSTHPHGLYFFFLASLLLFLPFVFLILEPCHHFYNLIFGPHHLSSCWIPSFLKPVAIFVFASKFLTHSPPFPHPIAVDGPFDVFHCGGEAGHHRDQIPRWLLSEIFSLCGKLKGCFCSGAPLVLSTESILLVLSCGDPSSPPRRLVKRTSHHTGHHPHRCPFHSPDPTVWAPLLSLTSLRVPRSPLFCLKYCTSCSSSAQLIRLRVTLNRFQCGPFQQLCSL